MTGLRAMLPLVGVAAAAAGLDQWSKHLVETGMELHERIDVLPFFALFRAHNTGIAFSMLSGMGGAPLIALTLVVIVFVLWLALRTPAEQRFARAGFALIIGGAVGNLIDRASLGYVIDYFLFFVGDWSFAIFNLADAFISVGAALVVLEEVVSWVGRRRRAGNSKGDVS